MYADYKDQTNQTLAHILGSFLRQFLTVAQEPIPDDIIKKLNQIQFQGRNAEIQDILDLLKIRLQQLKRAYIFIDAVDELESKTRQHLLDILKEMVIENNIRLFLTGRNYIESAVNWCFIVEKGYTIKISASQQDIREFVRQKIHDDDLNPKAMDEVLAKDIEDTIAEKSKGM